MGTQSTWGIHCRAISQCRERLESMDLKKQILFLLTFAIFVRSKSIESANDEESDFDLTNCPDDVGRPAPFGCAPHPFCCMKKCDNGGCKEEEGDPKDWKSGVCGKWKNCDDYISFYD